MTKQTRLRFGLICRVSTRGQLSGVSLEVQRERGEAYIKQAGGTVVEIYPFQESGRKALEDRVQFGKVMQDGARGKWDAIWTFDQTRLARNVKGMCQLIEFLIEHRLEWHTALGKMPIDTPAGKSVVQMMSVMGELETDTSSWKTQQSREKLLGDGHHAFGRWPYGRILHEDGKSWSIDRKAQRLMQRAFHYYVEAGKSLEQTAKLLDMPKTTLSKRLRSAGISAWRRTLTTPNGPRSFTLKIPALLTPKQAAAVERQAAENRTVLPTAGRNRSLLQGLVRCGHCGRDLSRTPSRKPDGSKKFNYRHPKNEKGERCFWHVPADLLERSVVRACTEVIEDNKKLKGAIERGINRSASSAAAARSEAKELAAAMASTSLAIDRAVDELTRRAQPGPVKNKLRAKLGLLEHRYNDLAAMHDGAMAKSEAGTVSQKDAAQIANGLRTLCGLNGSVSLAAMPSEQKRLLVSLVVGRSSRGSAHGIFVQMVRFSKRKKDVYWEWDLRGAMAHVQGTATRYEAFDFANDIKRIEFDDDATALQLAQLAMTIKPLRLFAFPSCSSGG